MSKVLNFVYILYLPPEEAKGKILVGDDELYISS